MSVMHARGEVPGCVQAFVRSISDDVDAGRLVGVQAYVSLAGETLLDVGIGHAQRGRPMLCETITHWLCCTKPLVALLVADLERLGKIDVNMPLAECWPEFGALGKERTTVRSLMNHTSGLAGDPAQEFIFCSNTELARAICLVPIPAAAEQRARYVDFTTWAALGLALSRATGEEVGQLMKRRVFARLGLRDSHLGMAPDVWDGAVERVAKTHVIGRLGPTECSFLNWREAAGYDWPAFGARGPAAELGRVYESLLGIGTPLIDASLVGRYTRASRGRVHDAYLEEAVDWGLGFISDAVFFGLDGLAREAFGHTGLGSSFSVALPEWNLVVVWVSNVVADPKVHRVRMQRLLATLVRSLRADGALS